MYPFWLEKQDEYFLFGIDHECRGKNEEEPLDEEFYAKLLMVALKSMKY
jgi:hypothetical protein